MIDIVKDKNIDKLAPVRKGDIRECFLPFESIFAATVCEMAVCIPEAYMV